MSDLVLTDVTVRRGKRVVLNAVTLALKAGRLTAVIGPNGAGKSTLLNVAAGLQATDNGRVELGGQTLKALGHAALSRRRAYLPQAAGVDWPLSVERVVALGLTPHLPAFGGLSPALIEKINLALTAYDLEALRYRPATELSGGERARAMLARATVGQPELLIVDEPTAGLDPRHALDATRRLRLLADTGCTVVMAVHDLSLALRFADDVLAIRDGHAIACGPVAEVLTEALLEQLYDVKVRLTHDADGPALRFLG